jgi:TolB protein
MSTSRALLSSLALGALLSLTQVPPAAAAPDRGAPLVGDRLVRVDQGEIAPLSLPVRPVASFAIAGDRVLFGAEPRAAQEGTDGWNGMNLWSVGLDGTAPRRLTRGRNVLRATASEPAGLIAYWTSTMEIWVMRPDGSQARRVASPGASPAFSPDGSRLAYARLPKEWRPGSLPGGFDLHVVELATGDDRELTSGYDDAEPVWTPDGRALLFLSGGRTGLTSFWRISAEGTELAQLTNAGQSGVTDRFVKNPAANSDTAWSPDGSMLLYSALYEPAGEVIVLDFDRTWAVREARVLGEGRSPSWAAQGTVQVIRDAAQGLEAVELPVRGEAVQRVTEVTGAPASTIELRPGRGVEFLAGGVKQEVDKTHTNPPRYRFPLSYQPGGGRYYYDNDTSAGALSWKCNGETYNGHRGSDFPAPCGTSVYAGHNGSVSARNDGCPNVGFWGSTCGGGFGNYVKINNGNNWYSIYAHMQSGTPIGFVGVACGQYIGTSYTSGNSTGCHLHFEVQHYGYPWDDPFGGSCSGPESFWCNQNGDGAGFPGRACC